MVHPTGNAAQVLRRHVKPSCIPMDLPWGLGKTLELRVPPTWQVIAQDMLAPPPPISVLAAAIRETLDGPAGSVPLHAMVERKTKIALVMDDAGQPTPVPLLAPVVLDCLLEAGAEAKNITGLFAIGTHQVMSTEDMEAGRAPLWSRA
jgi:nickel-dependent lactate racemase